MKKLMDMSVEELKAYKKTIIEKIETHLPELCNDIDEVIAIKKEAEDKLKKAAAFSASSSQSESKMTLKER